MNRSHARRATRTLSSTISPAWRALLAGPVPAATLVAALASAVGLPPAPARAQDAVAARPAEVRIPPPRSADEYVAAMTAKLLCSGLYVVGRDAYRTPGQVLAADLEPFPWFETDRGGEYAVDEEGRAVTMEVPGAPARTAVYNDEQGCTILPRGADDLHFEPVRFRPRLPAVETQPWPTGDAGARWERPPPGVDMDALDAALDWAMDPDEGPPQNTRALVVVYRGKILGERYRAPFGPHTPQISWSQGKSVTAALAGVLVEQGELDPAQPAPVAAWRDPDDPRSEITLTDLLRMSSGLDFQNLGLSGDESLTHDNDHFLIYFDAPHIFDHAVSQPSEVPPGTRWAYRNSDPLTLGRIVRETVEARGEEYLTFPQRALFDRIGVRNAVLETDAWGNFILTGYDFMSAMDWVRFGLLHLWDGVWEGERILAEGWVELVSTPAPADESDGYGGLFWLNAGGSYPRIPGDAFWAAGFMGQTTMIIPSRDMVVVRLGPSRGAFSRYFNRVVGDVLEAVGGAVSEEGGGGGP